MAAPNEVRIQIRHHILTLETFTIPQLQSLTGLNRHSIHSEMRRMEKEGFILKVDKTERIKGGVGGRPATIYQVTQDLEKRYEVIRSIKAFLLVEGAPLTPQIAKPTSEYYYLAEAELMYCTNNIWRLTEAEKRRHLNTIVQNLNQARLEEEIEQKERKTSSSYISFLEAKAVASLEGNWEIASQLLAQARSLGQSQHANDIVSAIDSYLEAEISVKSNQFITLFQRGPKNRRRMDLISQDIRTIGNQFDRPFIKTIVDFMSTRIDLLQETGNRTQSIRSQFWEQRQRELNEGIDIKRSQQLSLAANLFSTVERKQPISTERFISVYKLSDQLNIESIKKEQEKAVRTRNP